MPFQRVRGLLPPLTNIGAKLFVITFVSFLLGLLLVGGIAYYSMEKVVMQNEEELLEASVRQVEDYLQAHMTAIQQNLLYLSDPKVLDALALSDYQLLMDNMLRLNTDTIKSIYLMLDGEYAVSAPQALKYFVNAGQLAELYAKGRQWGFWWSQPYVSSFSQKTITAARAVESTRSGRRGVVAIDLNLDQLTGALSTPPGRKQMSLVLLSRSGELISTNLAMSFLEQTTGEHPMLRELKNKLRVNELSFDRVDLPEGSYKVLKSGRNRWDWVVFAVVNEADAYAVTHAIRQQYALLLALWIAVSLGISYWLGRYIRKPIKEISRQMNLGAVGSLGHRIAWKRTDEFGLVSSSYNKMMDRIETLFRDLQSMEEQKRYHELKVLQSQINPHFLYNALNTIYCLAESERTREIGPLIQSLVGIMRFSIDKIDQVVMLQLEIDNVWKYVDLMKLRFGDAFDMDVIVPEPYERAYIPKLTLLTLLENAIFYGLDTGRRNHIMIAAGKADGGALCVEVSDTGPGIPEETVRTLLSARPEQPDGVEKGPRKERKGLNNLGIRNVHERIQLHFGVAYGLDIRSKPGAGTTVRVRLPYSPGDGKPDAKGG